MASSRVGDIIGTLVAAGYLVYFAVRGFQERRPFWSSQSWWRFGFVCSLGVILFSIAMAMVVAVDRGIFKTTITSADGKSFFILGSMALLLGGAGIVGGMLSWFAFGDPERAFPGADKTVRPSVDQEVAS